MRKISFVLILLSASAAVSILSGAINIDSVSHQQTGISVKPQTTLTIDDTSAAVFASSNPFAGPSPLQYQAPPFDRVHDSDYKPAIEEGMRRQLSEIDKIATDPSPATVDNTIVAMEKSGDLLTRVTKVFFAMTQANTDDALQSIESEEAPKLAAHSDAIYLNDNLFRRVKLIYDSREKLGLDAVQKFLVRRYYLDFVRSGALLSEPDKQKLRALNQEESKLVTDFQNKLLAGTKAGGLVIDDKKELDGMSDAEIASGASCAQPGSRRKVGCPSSKYHAAACPGFAQRPECAREIVRIVDDAHGARR